VDALALRVAARFTRTAGSAWYHLTDRAKFKLDPKFKPADNAVAIEDRSGKPGIYLGQSVEKWVNGFGYWRPFVVEFKVDPSVVDDPGVSGRYGGEMFVPAASFGKLSIVRVIPIDAYCREEYGEPGWIEGDVGVAFDTGEPLPQRGHDGYAEAMKKFRGYRYPGPDVRNMPADEVARLKKQLRQVKHAATLQNPLQKALEEVGTKRRFTKADLRAALKSTPLDMHHVQQLVRSGYLAVDGEGYHVTELGWTWIHGGDRA
jgi:hypothetical protein